MKSTKTKKPAKKKINQTTKTWVQGYACAIAVTIAHHGHNTEHVEALEACGLFSEKDLRDHDVEEYDIEILKPVLKDSTERRAQHAIRAMSIAQQKSGMKEAKKVAKKYRASI